MSKNKYKISELANILGVSEVAIRKKIKDKRYRQRYEVVTETVNSKQVSFILLDNAELEEEKQLAFQNKNKFSQQNVYNNVEETDYIDVMPEKSEEETLSENQYITFTKLYIDKIDNLYETLHETQKETLEKDKQIYLLENLENRTKEDILATQAENKTLKIQMKRYQIVMTTFLLISVSLLFVMGAILMYQHFNPKKEVIEKEKQVIKVITVDHRGNVKSILTK